MEPDRNHDLRGSGWANGSNDSSGSGGPQDDNWSASWSSQGSGGTSLSYTTASGGGSLESSGMLSFWYELGWGQGLVSAAEPGAIPGQVAFGAGPLEGETDGLKISGGVDFPGTADYYAPTLGYPQVPPYCEGPSFVFGRPTLPGSLSSMVAVNMQASSLAGLAPSPVMVNAVWGMAFTAQAGESPVGGPGSWHMAYGTTAAPRTPFALGNTAGSSAVFTSEKIRGTDAVFGALNAAAAVPVTQSPLVVNYGSKGVSAGIAAGQPAAGTDPLTNVLVPVCFAAGTPILMADGTTKAIERIERGDRVRAVFHEEPEGPPSAGEVVDVYHNGPRKLVEVEVGGQVIRVTPKHPFYVRGRSWTAAAELRPGDSLRTASGGWIAVGSVVDNGQVEPVFNFEVAGLHTYFVGNGAGGTSALVHNQSGDQGGGNTTIKKPLLEERSQMFAKKARDLQQQVNQAEAVLECEEAYLASIQGTGTLAAISAQRTEVARAQQKSDQLTDEMEQLESLSEYFRRAARGIPTTEPSQTGMSEEEVIEEAIIEATNQISSELATATTQAAREKVVPLTARFIQYSDGSIKALSTQIGLGTLVNILAGDRDAKLFAMPLAGDQPVAITVNQFFHGTDEEVLGAVIHGAKMILEAQKSLRVKAGEAVDLIQGTLDALALFPFVGNVAAAGSGLIDLAKGNLGGAAFSFAAVIPIAGEAGAVAKVTKKFATAVEDVAKVAKISKIGRIAGEIVKAIRSSQLHHIATYFGGYGKKFERIFRRAGITGKDAKEVLDYAKNLIELAGHRGAHTAAYRKYVLKYLTEKVGGKTGKAAKEALDKALGYLRRKLAKDPRFPYK